jgi:hypothetical protein
MKYINKYIKMFENEVLERPVVKEQTKTATEKDVVDRLERIYKELSKEEKNEIDSYFQK